MSVVIIYLIFIMLAVIWYDGTRYIIPNWLVGSLLLVYPLAVWIAPVTVDWKMALAAMGGILVVGYLIFAMKWMGGGDIKLLTASTLWVGWENLTDFIFLVAILGGVLAIGLWSVRKLNFLLPKKLLEKPLPRLLREGEPVPYGLAISAAFLFMMWSKKIPVIL